MSRDRTEREQELATQVMDMTVADCVDFLVAVIQLRPNLLLLAKQKVSERAEEG